MSIKQIVILLSSLALMSCGGNSLIGGKYQENLKKLDKVYGYCDNPQRAMNKSSREYKICKDKERAAGADGLIDDEFKMPLQDILDGKYASKNTVYVSAVNKYLWSGSLNVLSNYSLKIADSQGGYIETEYDYSTSPSQKNRCAIKIQINSQDLISTGIVANILCQNESDGIWYDDGNDYSQESKQIVLKVLEQARILKNQDARSN